VTASERIEALLAQLTLDEKAAMTAGSGMWHSVAVPRLGIPAFKMSDGPNGVRGDGQTPGASSLNLPVGAVLGASWNPGLLHALGDALGQEARDKDVQVVLGPTINLQRLPIAGRNFECYSEDPLLTAELARAFVRGLQAHDVAACPKHFVGNEYERDRQSASSEIDERTLHEVYLAPFEAAVREAGAWTVMSAYNRLNGEFASSHHGLLTDVLKRDWGFDGVVISDWTGTYSGVPSARAGLDIEMPGPARHMGPHLAEAVRRGELDEAVVDEQVRRLLRLMARTGRLQRPVDDVPAEQSIDRPGTRLLARRALHEGMVLLHNDGLLPLPTSDAVARGTRIALIGPNAVAPQFQGGGSSTVRPRERVTPEDALRAQFGADNVTLVQGCDNERYLPLPDPHELVDGWDVRYFAGNRAEGEVLREHVTKRPDLFWFGLAGRGVPFEFSATVEGRVRIAASGAWAFSLMNSGRARLFVDGALVVDNWTHVERGDSYIGMGSTEVRGECLLQAGSEVAVRVEYCRDDARAGIAGVRIGMRGPMVHDGVPEAVAAARAADVAIVVVGLTPDWESEGFDRAGIELPGRQVELIRAVAAANPRTIVLLNAGSGIAIHPWVNEVAAVLHVGLPGQAFGDGLLDVLCGRVSPSGRLPFSVPFALAQAPGIASHPPRDGKVTYDEGIDIGYRGYQRARVMPALPLGFGRTYGRFEYSDLVLRDATIAPDGETEVRLTLVNEGPRDAAEVVQLYVTPLDAEGMPRADMPVRALAAFTKVEVPAGGTCEVSLRLPARRLARYAAGVWLVDGGKVRVEVGSNACELRLRGQLTIG
jgi:beta-glucosidase